MMSEQSLERKELLHETQEAQSETIVMAQENARKTEAAVENPGKANPGFSKKKITVIAAAVAVVAVIALVCLIPSKFERVQNECVHIAGEIRGNDDYFTIDTYPDGYENLDEDLVKLLLPDTQKKALEAIRYANEELGFNGSVYSKMMETTALMGRQSEENEKYKVSWTYHPNDGLEVTYEKK